MPVKPSLPVIILVILLLPRSGTAQVTAPGSTGPPPSSPSLGGGAATPPGSQDTPPPSAATAPAVNSAPQTGDAAPPAGAGPGATAGPSPVSPSVPFVGAPLPTVSAAPTPPAGQGTLPAAAPASLSATTPGAPPLAVSADDVVTLAARQNLGLLASLKDVLAARSGVQSARALSPPTFTIGPALEAGGTTDGLLFLQPLELNGTRGARTDIAQARLRLSQAQALVQLQSLVYTARAYFYALARAQAALALQQDLLGTAQRFDQIARQQVALGARPGIEQTQTAIEVARARQLVAQAQGEEQAARAALNAYLGRAPLDPVDTSRTLPPSATAAPPVDIPTVQQEALDGRAEVAAAQASRDVPVAQASLYRAQGRPDVSPSFRISQITPTYMDAGVGVVITVPIDYGTRRGEIRQSEQTAQAEADRLAGTQAQVRLDAEQAAVRLNAAQSVLGEYDAGLLADARKVLDAALYGFRAGQTTIIGVLDAQRTYRQVVSDQLNARASVAEARAALDRATGVLPPSLLPELERDFHVSQIENRLVTK